MNSNRCHLRLVCVSRVCETENDAKSLAEQVKVYWTETEDSANQAYANVKDWIFDS